MDGVNEGNNRAGFHRRGKRNRTGRKKKEEKEDEDAERDAEDGEEGEMVRERQGRRPTDTVVSVKKRAEVRGG